MWMRLRVWVWVWIWNMNEDRQGATTLSGVVILHGLTGLLARSKALPSPAQRSPATCNIISWGEQRVAAIVVAVAVAQKQHKFALTLTFWWRMQNVLRQRQQQQQRVATAARHVSRCLALFVQQKCRVIRAHAVQPPTPSTHFYLFNNCPLSTPPPLPISLSLSSTTSSCCTLTPTAVDASDASAADTTHSQVGYVIEWGREGAEAGGININARPS